MRIIIAGSRNFEDYMYLEETMLKVIGSLEHKDIEIISGMAKGADKLGAAFAKHHGFKLKEMPADWTRYGNSAGYRRNAEMASYAIEDPESMLVAFWDGESKGTGHMVDLAKKHNIKYVKIFQGGTYVRD